MEEKTEKKGITIDELLRIAAERYHVNEYMTPHGMVKLVTEEEEEQKEQEEEPIED